MTPRGHEISGTQEGLSEVSLPPHDPVSQTTGIGPVTNHAIAVHSTQVNVLLDSSLPEAQYQGEQLNYSDKPLEENIKGISDRVQADVHALMRVIMELGGLSTDEVNLPHVFVSDTASTSSYTSLGNIIIIATGHINCADTYAEEIFHCIHRHLMPSAKAKFDILPQKEASAVAELIGFAGSAIVRKLLAKDPSNTLAKNFRFDRGETFLANLKAEHNQSDTVLHKISSTSAQVRVAEFKVVSHSLEELANALRNQSAFDVTRIEPAIKRFEELVKWKLESLSSARNVFKFEITLARLLKAMATDVRECLNAFTIADSQEDRAIQAEKLRVFPHMMLELAKYISQELTSVDRAVKSLRERSDSLLMHREGYQAGLVFIDQSKDPERDIFDLMRMKPKHVYVNHVLGRSNQTPEGPSKVWKLIKSLQLDFFRLFTPVTFLEIQRNSRPINEIPAEWLKRDAA